jgi:lysophospholipase L1-like esterase
MPGMKSRRKAVVVSDSLTSHEPTNWLARVQARLPGVELVAEAHGGWTTMSYFRERLAHEAFRNVPGDAELCVILLGSNNLFEAVGGSDEAVAEATAGVVRVAEHVRKLSPSAKDVLLLAPPKVVLTNVDPASRTQQRRIDTHTPAYLAKLGASYRALASRRGWRYVDLLPVLSDDDYLDAAHPNAAGHVKLAEAISPAIGEWAAS